MDTTARLRTTASIPVSTDLFDTLEASAKRDNKSLRSYVEWLLNIALDKVHHKEQEEDDFVMTPELQARINKARQDYADGKYHKMRPEEDLDSFLNRLEAEGVV